MTLEEASQSWLEQRAEYNLRTTICRQFWQACMIIGQGLRSLGECHPQD